MSRAWFDQVAVKAKLQEFFLDSEDSLSKFGNTVNQTFEAFVFASAISWYRSRGWAVQFRHPAGPDTDERILKLKFSTNGKPSGYSFVVCEKAQTRVELRHQLRVSTAFHKEKQVHPANICLDVAILEADVPLDAYNTGDALPNKKLITFGEAKHMTAFAELVAGFIGTVHEMQPHRIRRRSSRDRSQSDHPSPFLYVSGDLNPTAQGVRETIEARRLDVEIFSKTKALSGWMALPTERPPQENTVHPFTT